MLKIPLDQIISKINSEKGLSEEEINVKIDAKLKQLSGLISREGAAHIIANELGVKIFEEFTGKLQIKNILSGMRSVETVGKVVRKFELREFQTERGAGKVANLIVGDETGTIRIVLWGDQAMSINKLNDGDIVKVQNAYVRENQGRKELHMNDRAKLFINPPGETIGEVKQDFQEQRPVAQRKSLGELEEGMQDVEVFGVITQTFEPRFFTICPQCGKRAKPDGDRFMCATHLQVTPNYSYVLNCFLDDGTENIRCVFFKNQADKLLSLSEQDILKFKDAPQDFEAVKTKLLGNQIKLVGRVVKNEMFDRIEFMTQLVFPNPDPQEEIKRLQNQ